MYCAYVLKPPAWNAYIDLLKKFWQFRAFRQKVFFWKVYVEEHCEIINEWYALPYNEFIAFLQLATPKRS